MALSKPLEMRKHWIAFVRHEFRQYQDISPRDVHSIEYLQRKYSKMIETYSNSSVTSINLTQFAKIYIPYKEFNT